MYDAVAIGRRTVDDDLASTGVKNKKQKRERRSGDDCDPPRPPEYYPSRQPELVEESVHVDVDDVQHHPDVEVPAPVAFSALQVPSNRCWLVTGDFKEVYLPIPTPRFLPSILWTVGFALVFSGVLAYGDNERRMNDFTWRGAVFGLPSFVTAIGVWLVSATVLACGEFRHRYHSVWVVTVVAALAIGNIRIGADLPGPVLIVFASNFVGYFFGAVVVNTSSYVNRSHKVLARGLAAPLVLSFSLFGFTLVAYLHLVEVSEHWAVGLLLPLTTEASQKLMLSILRRSFINFYFTPKERYKQWVRDQSLQPKSDSDSNQAPLPIHGDIGSVFGMMASLIAMLIENTKVVAMAANILRAPDSKSWVSSLALSFVSEAMLRTGVQQALFARISTSCPQNLPLARKVFASFARVDAISAAFLRAQFGCGYVAIVMISLCSVVRAINLGQASALMFADVGSTIPLVIGMQLLLEIVLALFVHVAARNGVVPRPPSGAKEGQPQPLMDLTERDMSIGAYYYVFGVGSMNVFVSLWMFLGSDFLSGTCPAPSVSVVSSFISSAGC